MSFLTRARDLGRPIRTAQILILSTCLLAALLPAGAQDADPEAELSLLKSRIGKLQKEIQARANQRSEEFGQLRKEEKRVSAAAQLLDGTRKKLAESQSRQKALLEQQKKYLAGLGMQRDALSAEVRQAYMGGRNQRLKLALNQQDPARLGRLMVYYRYLSENRARQISEVTDELNRLADVEQKLAAETMALGELEQLRKQELSDLESARNRRREIVATLDTDVARRGKEVETLKEAQKDLEQLIEELRKALENMPGTSRDPFADQRGDLTWPVTGKLLSDFGQPRAGGSLRWNGVLVGTDRGAEVRAVYHGRVAYSDWLPGLGLLIVIEHGDGYMSLYGHNETLFKQVGEWVSPSDVIATTGDSGGRSQAALYFEIRKGARPENPHRWLKGSLRSR
ncbi:MAG: murein hydrolase activator EnvC family protein [Gammaproteobacteria bacterium]